MSPRPHKLVRACAAAALAGTLAAGCGEDADQVTAEELISRGDALCREGKARFDQVQATPPANAFEAEKQTDELVEIASDELNELRMMRPPDELREAYDSYLEARGRAVELLEQGRDAAENQDSAAYAKAQAEAAVAQAERLRLAKAVGFKVCSAASSAAGPAKPAAGQG
jgi:ElaB/YqjD/DUF883 family membrane-anchored ribosome-binding protein